MFILFIIAFRLNGGVAIEHLDGFSLQECQKARQQILALADDGVFLGVTCIPESPPLPSHKWKTPVPNTLNEK